MRILPVTELRVQKRSNNSNSHVKMNYSPSMTALNKKISSGNVYKKILNYFKFRSIPSEINRGAQERCIGLRKPISMKNVKAALHTYVKNENFNKKILVNNADGSYELFYRKFDPVTHETRINSDTYDLKGKLHHTTVYDKNGLKLSQYFVKINNPKDPVSIRRKDFNVAGKIVHEEISYKSGEITYIDYDYLRETQQFETVKTDGTREIITASKYSSAKRLIGPDGKIISDNILNF